MNQNHHQPQPSLALTIEQAQEACCIGRTRLYELLKSGALPARKLGKRTLVLRTDLDKFLSNLAAYPTQPEVQQ